MSHANAVMASRNHESEMPTTQRPVEEIHVGSRLGDYELVDVLGRGGMAVVYLARQVSLDRLVALKMIAAPKAADAPTQERFRREARAVAQLDHSGIVAVHNSGMLDGALFYTMDYVEGPDLARVLRERRLPVREAAQLVQKIAEAIGYAHDRGIIHRDLKPANVLMDSEGEPRVTDFGLAFEGAGGGMTLTGDLLGTPPYMAPEMLAGGAVRAAPAADVYSLGAMLFQMLTGRTPFMGDAPSEILHLALSEEPPSVRLLNPAVPRDLQTIVLKCLEKAPERRYENGQELADDLRRFLADEPIHARPASTAVRMSRWSRRHPALATLIVASALGALGGMWAGVAINSGRQRALRAEAEAREQLWQANLAHAQAARRTTQAGARAEALHAIADAAKFRPTIELRNEAIAALALEDVVVQRSWPLPLALQADVAFEPSLQSYVAEIEPGLLVRRSCADDHEISRLDAAGKKIVGVPVFSPDARYLAARYADNVVRVWDVNAARITFELPNRPSPVQIMRARAASDLAFRPDGSRLAVGNPAGGFTVHALPDGEEQGGSSAAPPAKVVKFSPDGLRVAVIRDLPEVRLLDAGTLEEQRTIPLPASPTAIAWSPASDRLAISTIANRIHLTAAATGEILETITVSENGAATQLLYHPRLPILVAMSSDATIRFWDAITGRFLRYLVDVDNRPVLTFNAEGAQLAGYSSTLHRAALVEIQTSPVFHAAAPPPRSVPSAVSPGALGLSPDGKWLVSSSFGSVQVRNARDGEVVHVIEGKGPEDMMTAQFAPDGAALFIASSVSGLSKVDFAAGGASPVTLGAPMVLDAEAGFTIVAVANDGRLLMVNDGSVKIFDPAGSRVAASWPVPKISSATFTPDRSQVLTVAGESFPGEAAVKVWDLSTPATPKVIASFGNDVGGRVQCAGRWLLITGTHKTELRHLGTWELGPALPAELQGEPFHARLSADGATVVIEKSRDVYLLASPTGQLLAKLQGTSNPAGICLNEIFSADGARLTLRWQYGVVQTWDLAALHQELGAIGLDWATEK